MAVKCPAAGSQDMSLSLGGGWEETGGHGRSEPKGSGKALN